MKKQAHTFKTAVLYAALAVLLMVAGCSNDSTSAKIDIQLTDAASIPYQVDQMTVTIQKAGEPALTGVTNASGIATITVTSTGTYNVTQVAGVDATTLAEGSVAGREFKKANPLVDPFPYLTFIYAIYPVANVTSLEQNYNVNASVPLINKVTVLKVGSAISADSGEVTVAVGTNAFTGRVIIRNLNCNDNRAGLQIVSSDANTNRMHLYMNTTGQPIEITDTYFYGGPADTQSHTGFVNSYTQAGPIYFEAPGTDSGDWALGYNLAAGDLKTRAAIGGVDATRNFPAFDGGVGNFVFRTWSTAGGVGHAYSFDYRIFQFDEY